MTDAGLSSILRRVNCETRRIVYVALLVTVQVVRNPSFHMPLDGYIGVRTNQGSAVVAAELRLDPETALFS